MSASGSHSQRALLIAFKAVAADGAARNGTDVSLYRALSETADAMRKAGEPIARVVACVKALASEAGICETQDRVLANAVAWAIRYYYRSDIEWLLSVGAEFTRASMAPREPAVDSATQGPSITALPPSSCATEDRGMAHVRFADGAPATLAYSDALVEVAVEAAGAIL